MRVGDDRWEWFAGGSAVAEAMVPEPSDYFVHFCGLECYEKWKSQVGKPKEQAEKGGS